MELTYDGLLSFAKARHCKDKNWKNKEYLWSDIVAMFKTPARTAESYAEYLSCGKTRQSEIKDGPCFVGGHLAGGKRGKGSVSHRQILTLDMDFGSENKWHDFTMMYNNAAAMYTTHKHSKDMPRVRLIVPLDRPVMCDEYVAIGRRIAGVVGIEAFDPTGYQPERLMYLPSASKDGLYETDYQDGPWLCADDILATYRDWRDSSEWPCSDRENVSVQRDIKKQGDPLEKRGVVGAFCRSYTIHEAIEKYLADVYLACDVEDRYTFVGGSTSAGLITYEDKYAYSHHGTDPTSMQLCNAFDLVRIHLYGLRDEDTQADTPITQKPSFRAMEDLAAKDGAVRKLLVDERLQAANDDFKDIQDDEDEEAALSATEGSSEKATEPENDEWKEKLDTDKKGVIRSTIDNMVVLLQNAPELKGRFARDEFSNREILLKKVYWHKQFHKGQFVTDDDVDILTHHMEKFYGISSPKIRTALTVIYNSNKVHPVREYLAATKWDGVRRVDSLLIDYMGAEDTPYVRAVTRKTLVAACARIHKPGIKFDNVLTLVGEEGKYKSTLFRKLAGSWFSDSFHFGMLKNNQASEQLQGHWIVEIGEMSGYRKSDLDAVKGFLSRLDDIFRPAYGRTLQTFLRQNIFVASTNDIDFLHGNNGNRRFWPVWILRHTPAKSVPVDLTVEVVAQVWAEAMTFYNKGETLHLTPEVEKLAKVAQLQHTEEHPLAATVANYLAMLLPEDWDERGTSERRNWLSDSDPLQPSGTVQRDRACLQEIWCEALGRQLKDLTAQGAREIVSIMDGVKGWAKSDRQMYYGKLYKSQRRGYVLMKDHVSEANRTRKESIQN